jgi:DNA-binding NarL/FixJ family response regulator
VFIEGQCVIDRELRGLQQKSLGKINGFSDSEYEILLDIALGLTDRVIAKRHNLSLRSVQKRLQQLYDKLGLYQTDEQDSEESRYNLRCRAVTVAFLRKLLNYSALEKAEAEFSDWQRDRGSPRALD